MGRTPDASLASRSRIKKKATQMSGFFCPSPSLLKYGLATYPECAMSRVIFSDFEYAGKRKQTRRERFLTGWRLFFSDEGQPQVR